MTDSDSTPVRLTGIDPDNMVAETGSDGSRRDFPRLKSISGVFEFLHESASAAASQVAPLGALVATFVVFGFLPILVLGLITSWSDAILGGL